MLDALKHVQTPGVEIGPELMARVHYWQASALARQRDTAGADRERASARKLIAGIQATLPRAVQRSLHIESEHSAFGRVI